MENLVTIQFLQSVPTISAECLSFAFVNCHSVVNKIPDLQYELCNRKVNLCCLAETGIKDDDTTTPCLVPPGGYKIVSYPKPDCTGGGVALVCTSKLDLIRSRKYTFQAIECADFSLKYKSETLHVIIIYRPPDTSILSSAEEFVDLMEMNTNSPGHLIIMGDVNNHMNNSADNDTITMNDLPDSFNLMNNVLVPTHRLQNTVEIVLTDAAYTKISQVKRGTLFSEHHLITLSVAIRSNTANHKTKVIACRKHKTIDYKVFTHHINTSPSDINLLELTLDQSAELYEKVLIGALDVVASIKVKVVSDRQRLSWFIEG